jgi:hypothetical protein
MPSPSKSEVAVAGREAVRGHASAFARNLARDAFLDPIQARVRSLRGHGVDHHGLHAVVGEDPGVGFVHHLAAYRGGQEQDL